MGNEGSRLFDPTVIGRRRLRRSVLIAVAALLVLRLVAEATPLLRRPDLVLLDFWQSLRATRNPSPQVVIVGIDEKSIARFGPPAWPRKEYLFAFFLESKFGRFVMNDIWFAMKAEPFLDAIASVLESRATDFEHEYATFGFWNYFTADRTDSLRYYSEGRLYPRLDPNMRTAYNVSTRRLRARAPHCPISILSLFPAPTRFTP